VLAFGSNEYILSELIEECVACVYEYCDLLAGFVIGMVWEAFIGVFNEGNVWRQ
jgi:hypothetical protein